MEAVASVEASFEAQAEVEVGASVEASPEARVEVGVSLEVGIVARGPLEVLAEVQA